MNLSFWINIIEKEWDKLIEFPLLAGTLFCGGALIAFFIVKFLYNREISILNATIVSLKNQNKMPTENKQKIATPKIALDEFKTSFTGITFDLRDAKPDVIFQLPKLLEHHEKAKIKLELSLGPKEAKQLNKVWKQYRNNTKEYYSRLGGSVPSSDNWPKKFLKEIEDMLNKVSRIT